MSIQQDKHKQQPEETVTSEDDTIVENTNQQQYIKTYYKTPPYQMARQVFVLIVSIMTAVLSIFIKRITDNINNEMETVIKQLTPK